MTEYPDRNSGGCLCGSVRYRLNGPPMYAGHCYCCDCRKASGSGFIPFMSYDADNVEFSGKVTTFISVSARGGDSARNFCPDCGALVFGGEIGKDTSFTIYAGTLDDPSLFVPQIAIFARGRPEWAMIPASLTIFDGIPA